MSKNLDIYLKYRNLIRVGTLVPGDRLPSLRDVARAGGYGINTVRSAFALLERDGLVSLRERSGAYVKRGRILDVPSGPPDRYVEWDRNAGERLDLVFERLARSDRGFAIASPGRDLLPERKLARLFASLEAGWIEYAEPKGELELRRRLALHYEPVNGITSPDDIMITNGATEAISLVVRSFVRPGDVVIVESPTYYDYFRQLAAAQATIVEIRTTAEHGIDLDALEAALLSRPVRMILVQPNVQNPTGSTMSIAAKRRLIALAREHEVVLVQDDVYGDTSFSAERPVNLPLLGDFPNLILLSSCSKSLAPGLRTGWIRATALMPQLAEAKIRSSLETSPPAQRVLASYLSTRAYSAHLLALRSALSRRLDEYLNLLEDALPPGSTVSRPTGGCLLWVSFPPEVDATEAFLQAAREGVVAVPGELFSAHPHFRNFFRINAGRALIPQRRAELQRLCDIARQSTVAPGTPGNGRQHRPGHSDPGNRSSVSTGGPRQEPPFQSSAETST